MATTYLDLTNELLRELNEIPLTSANFSNAIGFQAFVKDANPFDTLAWVINLRLSLNLDIPKGSKIITGSVIKTRSPKKGDIVRYNVGDLSETKIRII